MSPTSPFQHASDDKRSAFLCGLLPGANALARAGMFAAPGASHDVAVRRTGRVASLDDFREPDQAVECPAASNRPTKLQNAGCPMAGSLC